MLRPECGQLSARRRALLAQCSLCRAASGASSARRLVGRALPPSPFARPLGEPVTARDHQQTAIPFASTYEWQATPPIQVPTVNPSARPPAALQNPDLTANAAS